MSFELDRIGWPTAAVPQALAFVARRYGVRVSDSGADAVADESVPDGWIEHCAARLGLEALPVKSDYRRLRASLASSGPALLRLSAAPAPRFLLVIASGRHRLTVLTPALNAVRLRLDDLHSALASPTEAQAQTELASLLAAVAPRRRRRAGEMLVRERLADYGFALGWMLRPAAGGSVRPWLREYGLWAPAFGLVAGHTASALLWLLSWWWLAQAALGAELDAGRFAGWALLIASALITRVGALAASGVLSVRVGALLKRRLLEGALRLNSEEVRAFGIGQFLGRVGEGESLEHAATSGGLLGLMALIDLALAAGVLIGAGRAGLVLAGLLALWTVAGLALTMRYYRRLRQWTEARLNLTNALVEAMAGHRTRLAQGFEPRERVREDIEVERYLHMSQDLDRTGAWLETMLPRGWLLGGILGLAPMAAAGDVPVTALALVLGGILLTYQAFHELAGGLERVAAGAAAWSWIRPFWEAAVRPAELGLTRHATARAAGDPGFLRIEARGLQFRYAARTRLVLDGIDFFVREGERVLLGGPSGGGKSTLASLLAGLRAPQSGQLLLDGLDRTALGDEAWRRRVLVVPQFHENTILMGTLAFNLLLGRGWPADSAALEEAEQVCRALGLGPLLERMPGGLNQVVGETGWQLSHGERDRVYLARALLQRPDILILDETLSALDPLTMREVFAVVDERAPTLLLIAHT